MTKVEELRDKMTSRNIRGVVDTPDSFHSVSVKELDSLISAAHAEGVAEGKEEKRLEILSTLSWNTLITESYERGKAEGAKEAAEIERMCMAHITGLSELQLSLMQNDSNLVIFEKIKAEAYNKGLAAGAEQERERIRRMQLCGRRVQVSQFPDDERRNLRIETDVDGVAYTLVPASALAPTKEKP